MKKHMKRGLSLLLALALLVSVTLGLNDTASAAEHVYNWGVRGRIATYLSEAAESFYTENDVTYDELISFPGSTTVSAVPDSPLYDRLQELMEVNHTHITDYAETRTLYQYTDCQNGGGRISSFYSGVEIGPEWDGGGTWNREHTWPNSKGLNGDDENDLMMLRPTAKSENSSRGNKAYGESSGYYNPNSESGGTYDLRGDVARIMLYTYVRWGNTDLMWGTAGVMESKEVLLKWMEEDPVDTWELGRNDAVEAITGTRNVFVDYPELSFLLFNEEIPDGMVTPSGSMRGQYTINAVSSAADMGCVSVNGAVIDAIPADGCEIAGYEVTEGTASVYQYGNSFVVLAVSDCTILIQFKQKNSAGIFFWENGALNSSHFLTVGETVTLPDPIYSAPEDCTFVGWATETVADSPIYPTLLTPGSSCTVNETTCLYAVYSYTVSGGSENYVLVTDADQLTIGSSVVIAAADYDYALSTNQKNNNRGTFPITKSDDKSTIAWGSPVNNFTVAELVLGVGSVSGSYSFYCNTVGGYLYCASAGNKNLLKTQEALDEKGSFTITVNDDGTCSVVSQTTSSDRRIMRYNPNSGDPLFACYSAGQNALSLYVKTTGGTATYYTTGTAPVCAHDNAVYEEATAHWTAGLYCYDCEVYVFGHEPISVSNHLPGDINGDGDVNNKDATRLFQYLSGWEVDVVEEALDVNGDGSVNNKDATRLFQYLSGWNVEIH